MRILPIFLFWAMLALSPLSAQPVPTLQVATDREYYRSDSSNKVYLEMRVGTIAGTPTTPSAGNRNLALVLDRSGSMAGAPIQALRQAMATTLNSLSEHDVVSVILFGSEVETLVEAKHRDQLGNLDTLLAQIEPAGGAALYDALNQGAAQLRRHAGPSTVNHLILVTDGPPTKGPRELDDFTKLAEVFAREGFTLSTIGLGEDFNEDMLAALARIGNGRFRYAAQPDKIAETLQAEIAPQRAPVARDAVLTVEFGSDCEDIATYGWKQAAIEHETVTYRFPYLFADQELVLLASANVRPRRFSSYKAATVNLRWNDLTEGNPHEIKILRARSGEGSDKHSQSNLTGGLAFQRAADDATPPPNQYKTSPGGSNPREIKQTVSIVFEADADAFRQSGNPAVIRTSVSTLISEGMQRAIEMIDKGDFKRALRALRRARDDAKSLNYDLEDKQAQARIGQLETYLAEVQARGLNQLDRKILRSGLFNQFETPTEEPKDRK